MAGAMGLPPRFEELWRHCAVLCEDNYWVAASLGDEELEQKMRAAAFVLRGSMLQKFRKSGRERPHLRYVRAEYGAPSSMVNGNRQVLLHWDKKSAVLVRADDEVYQSCFQGDGTPDAPGCFQVILDKRMLFLVAESPDDVR